MKRDQDPPRHSDRGMPNLFVIGAMKCGTSSLHHYLGLHPEISMSSIKEPMYFLPEDFRASWRHSPVAMSREEYLALFDARASIRGESSTLYSAYPLWDGIPARIHAEVPDAKLVYLVRDPVERIPSAWVQMVQGGRDASLRTAEGPKPLAEQIGDFEDPENIYTWPGMYMTQIGQFLDYFPSEALLVVDSDELRGDRESVITRVFRFLGVDPDFTDPGFLEERNPSRAKKVESGAYIRLTRSRALRRAVDLLPGAFRERAIRKVRGSLAVQTAKPELTDDLRRRLEDHFRAEVAELREFTGQEFAGWSI